MSLVTRVLMGFFVLVRVFIVPVTIYAATHIVSPGESLSTISRSYGITLNSLMEANGIRDSLIYPGQQIYVPENGLHNSDIYSGMSLYIPTVSGITTERQSIPQVSRGSNFQRPTPADVDLLARLITAEADAEPYEGKVAVGAVVLNRVASSDFPHSIHDVIYQHRHGTYQFEPVKNGRINKPASSESIKAAKDALNGWDPTKGALYFFASYVKNPWFWSKPLSRIIGGQVFTY